MIAAVCTANSAIKPENRFTTVYSNEHPLLGISQLSHKENKWNDEYSADMNHFLFTQSQSCLLVFYKSEMKGFSMYNHTLIGLFSPWLGFIQGSTLLLLKRTPTHTLIKLWSYLSQTFLCYFFSFSFFCLPPSPPAPEEEQFAVDYILTIDLHHQIEGC